ncbi:acyl-CoA dehydrogenase family protein [Cryptosporangium aurantiacum]|uniref:Acyl-CoA dehydrogenase n=1 Tax=Cryptosporangium aurantiacum TaxID=134849 RepID=A0A1M7JZJ3_9ACTN|nr:acyl-CoA dehydrogenase family protein [Cryptosporangium aurantiacum]SHM58375.1 Acyl-CoA dehydrogenase [Cryptosporangium aurantiacum]
MIFSEEQEELRRTVRTFLERTSPESAVRRLMETDEGYDAAVWKQMGEQLGLQGIHIPEEYGGAGFGFVELCLVLEEMGAALLPAPFFASAVLAAEALLESDDEDAKKELLPGIASGETIATLAYANDAGHPDGAVEANSTPAGYTLTGTRHFVLDGALADLILVVACADAGPSLFAVQKGAEGLSTVPLSTMDLTRKQADLTFDATPARLIGAEGAADGVLDRVLWLACVALVNESVGGARAVLAQATRYATERLQFGRPIGSFQAIKHKCADMLVAVEGSRSAAYHAAAIAQANDPSLPAVASLAKSYVGEAYFSVAAENIQVHGGIGFTWEHPAHLYFKRAKSSQLLFGDPLHHRELLAQRFGL